MLNGNGSPISRIALGVLQDFGWNVDMSKSEHFTLSSTIPSIEYNDDNAIYINVDQQIVFNLILI